MKRTITAVLFALSMSNIGAAGTKSRCQESLEEGGWTVHLSDKFNEIDTIALAACIYFTGGAGTLQCLGDVVQEVAQEIGWDLLQKTIENRGRIVSGPGELKTQVGVCSKTYPIALGARGTDHYVFLRYKRGSVESSVATNSMQWYHDDCNAVHRSQTAACTASAHRYCVDQQHSLGGLSQEVGPTGFAIACINKEKGRVYEVPLSQFQSIHGDCNSVHNSRTAACTAAAHRYCNSQGYSFGLTQEVGSSSFGVACFNGESYDEVSVSKLRNIHSGCDSVHKSQSDSCVAAIHRYCANEKGLGAGVAQEVGSGSFGVACFNPGWFGQVSLR